MKRSDSVAENTSEGTSRRNPRLVARPYWPADGVHSAVFRARYGNPEQILPMADLAVDNKLQFWHPWHMEPTYEALRVARSRAFAVAPNGDGEWIHSLARGFHILDLAAASALTSEARYRQSFLVHAGRLARSHDSRWTPWGNNLDCALRLMHLIKALDLIERQVLMPDRSNKMLEEMLRRDIAHFHDQLLTGIGNWAFFIVVAVLTADRCLSDDLLPPGLSEQARMHLDSLLQSEINADGVEIEYAPMYHGESVLALLDYVSVLTAQGADIPGSLCTRLEQMLTVLERLADPDGNIPTVGDSDVLPVDYILNFAGLVLHGPRKTPESADKPLDTFPDTGWAIVRWRDDPKPGYLFFEASGRPISGHDWHSHADALNMTLHSPSGPLLVDPGRFTYATYFPYVLPILPVTIYPQGRLGRLLRGWFDGASDRNLRDWRSYFKSSLSHNIVAPSPRGLPGYGRNDPQPICRLTLASHTGPLVRLEGVFEGISGNIRVHTRRTIVGILPHLWVIIDRAEASRPLNWTGSWHLAPGVHARQEAERFRLEDPTGKTHLLSVAADCRVQQIVSDWVSRRYNIKEPSQTVQILFESRPQLDMVSVFALNARPDEQVTAQEMKTSAGALSGWAISVAAGDRLAHVWVDESGAGIKTARLSTDAAIAAVVEEGGTPKAIAWLDGTHVNYDNATYAAEPGRREGAIDRVGQ